MHVLRMAQGRLGWPEAGLVEQRCGWEGHRGRPACVAGMPALLLGSLP